MYRLIFSCLLLAAIAVCAERGAPGVERKNIDAEVSQSIPIATIESGKGLLVNGVATPRGVNSALIAPGDVIGTLDVPAVVRYMDGRTMTLKPATLYTVSSSGGNMLVQKGSQPLLAVRPNLLPPVSVVKP